MRTVNHPDFEPGAEYNMVNVLKGLCRPIFTITAKVDEETVCYCGNSMTQAAEMWADNGRGEILGSWYPPDNVEGSA